MLSMNRIKTWFRRMKFVLKHDFFTVPNVVLLIAMILGVSLTYNSITAMTRNWELSEKLTAERKELELVTVEVEAAELENEYYKSAEYQELVARKTLDKQLPGEHMVVMPENSEEAKNRHKEATVQQVVADKTERSNFEKWMMFLFPSF